VADMPGVGGFEVPSSKRAKVKLDLAPYYSLTRAGQYRVTARVRLPGWDKEISSQPKDFTIIEGTRLWEQEVGVPGTGEPGKPLEVRRYLLQQALYLRETRLYVRVTDGSGAKTIRTVAVGRLPGLSRPEAVVDGKSNMHLMYQSGPQDFQYLEFDTDGALLKKQRYDYVGTRPRLELSDGTVREMGGVRHEAPTDLPASNTVSKTSSEQLQ
jgi:hypothetical protein